MGAAQSNAAAARANLDRLNQLQSYLTVRAPFAGVVTVRNIDDGVLVNEGSTLLYRVAQTNPLRIYLNVPQVDADSVRVGQHATLMIPDLPGRKFPGVVARTANALDPATRTLLVEVRASDAGGILLPGMYAQVDLSVPRKDPPLLIPGDTLVVRSDGPQVAVVAADGTVHFAARAVGPRFRRPAWKRSPAWRKASNWWSTPATPSQEGVKVKSPVRQGGAHRANLPSHIRHVVERGFRPAARKAAWRRARSTDTESTGCTDPPLAFF